MGRYSKQPPNKPFNGTSCTRYDSGYERNKVEFTVLGEDLQIRFCATLAPKRTTVDFYIVGFRKLTAVTAIRDITKFCVTEGVITSGEWGRHFEDGVHEIWKALELPFGYVKPITRMWNGNS